jgi:filamentous hemagglutinin family protein
MTTRRSSGYFQAVLAGVLLYAATSLLSVSHAQVTSSGLNTSVAPSGGNFDITGGMRPGGGTNLFHSFGNFSLNAGESANFLNTPARPATTNILSRVTGGNPSNIFGTINTLDFPGANLFLMNPAGILFGPTAQLNVDGSFHATTADYIKLGTDGIFYADPTKQTVLSVAPPSAFGFLAANPAPIDVQTGAFNPDTGEIKTLSVPEGKTLSLVGGTVNLGAPDGSAPGYLVAPGGRINLVGMGPGEATLDDANGFNLHALGELGTVNIRGASIVDAKDVFIRGGRLVRPWASYGRRTGQREGHERCDHHRDSARASHFLPARYSYGGRLGRLPRAISGRQSSRHYHRCPVGVAIRLHSLAEQ